MKKYIQDYLFLLSIAAIIVIFDQWTKQLVRTLVPLGGIWSPWPWLIPYARIVHWQNTGAAFGMLQNFGMVFTVLAFIVAIAILYYFPRVPRTEWAMRLAMTMQMGGAIGNLIDRLTQGTVTDFISVGTFAVFNVADASISVGTAILVLAVWLSERKQKKLAEIKEKQLLSGDETPGYTNQIDWLPEASNSEIKPPEADNQAEKLSYRATQPEETPDIENQVNHQPDAENHPLE